MSVFGRKLNVLRGKKSLSERLFVRGDTLEGVGCLGFMKWDEFLADRGTLEV